MYQVYILQSLVDLSKTYVGVTIRNLEVRLDEHNKGISKYTKIYKPWRLIYYENFYCRLCAEKREKFLKSGFGFRFREMILRNYSALQKGQ